MRRRGNKSTKVPNVKLRPAEKGAYARVVEESCWAQETQPDSDDRATIDPCPRPLKDVCICATGVQDKPTLFKQAVELGATCTPAFTDRVTHLVAVDHGGAKYGCALERKIPIVKPSWIMENYQIWLKGDDFDFDESVQKHRLPIFSGVVVCPSGISDITTRTRISKLVSLHQGQYLKNLERPVRVTHLLCAGDEETDKMRYADKFNERGEARIHLVWEEWFWDSLEFGGRFEEGRYEVRRPRPGRKSLPGLGSSSSPTAPPPSSEVPSLHDECPSGSDSPCVPRKPHLSQKEKEKDNLNVDEAAEDEPAFVNVLPAVTLQLWGSLLQRRGYEVADGEVILSPSKAKANKDAAMDVDGVEHSPLHPLLRHRESPVANEEMLFGAARSVISSFRRVNSFMPVVSSKGKGKETTGPFRRSATANAVVFGASASASGVGLSDGVPGNPNTNGNGTGSANAIAGPSTTTPPPTPIFVGMKIRALGEAKGPTVRTAVEQHGGTWVVGEDGSDEVDYIVVRLVSGSKFYRAEEDEHLKRKYRTECWLEQCIYADRICAPEEQISSVPLGIEIPVLGAERIVVAISGFDQSEACGLKRLFRALGITFAATFSRKSTHLLCPSGTGQKFDKAREWGIPVVGREWLVEMAKSGDIPDVRSFLVEGSIVPLVEMDVDMHIEGDGDGRKDGDGKGKGKGKAVDWDGERVKITGVVDDGDAMDVQMESNLLDITNDIAHHQHASLKNSKKFQPLERGDTIIVLDTRPPPRAPVPGGAKSFGAPHLLQVSSSSINVSSSSINVSSSSLASLGSEVASPAGIPHQQESFTYSSSRQVESALNLSAPESQSHSNSNSNLKLQRQTTSSMRDVRHGPMQGERIPSSASPSPMKIQMPMQRTNSRGSVSPVKIDMEAARALQDSIASLLGKRPADGEEGEGDAPGLAGDLGVPAVLGAGGEARLGGGARRTRPKRSKVSSRQVSEADLRAAAAAALEADLDLDVPSSPSAARGLAKARRTRPSRGATRTRSTTGSTSAGSFNGDLGGNGAYAAAGGGASDQGKSQQHNSQDEATSSISVRVTYEDPTQREEKEKLMEMLLNNQSQGTVLMLGTGVGDDVSVVSSVSVTRATPNLNRRPRRTSSRIAHG